MVAVTRRKGRGPGGVAGLLLCLVLVLLLCLAGPARAGHLTIDMMVGSRDKHTAWAALLDRFAAANPDIQITHREVPMDLYWQRAGAKAGGPDAPDVAFWDSGKALRDGYAQRMVAPLPPDLARLVRDRFSPPAVDAVTVGAKVAAVPLSTYPWGFFYRKSLFQRLNLAPPRTWEELLAVAARLKAAEVTPFAFGAQENWPLFAWFDCLDLRLNGLDFHRRLLAGHIPFTDPAARAVMARWKLLLDRGYFHAPQPGDSWRDTLPYFYHQQVGMLLLGGFAAMHFSPLVRDDVGFIPFPTLIPGMPRYEDAPQDVLVVAPRAAARPEVQRFVRFLAETAELDRFNSDLAMVSPLRDGPGDRGPAPAGAGTFFQDAGRRVLEDAAGFAAYFDRDATTPLAEAAGGTFRRFMAAPHDIDAALAELDRARTAAPGVVQLGGH
ncbi:extracellular solute-binding protein [Nitrospirillum sp. BR 11164]|uniref:ABC transporter substrate-binding protein n=1 Tax=Nitrospirillum sp. BR 11164 TaxID=3104324 RepID=UPI002AFE6DB0|nr:extracellular solute-binding protein [Nitrospirillum sp. BR 11164]MEA1651052.1 extracellular solute-binding protein [Nitrospirillum sp. BR 11164]